MESLSLYEGSYTFTADEFNLVKFRSSLNYPELSRLPEPITEFLDKKLLPSLSISPVLYQYCLSPIFDRDPDTHSVKIASGNSLTGPIIYRFLRHSTQVIILLASIQREQFYEDWEDYIAYSFYNTLLHQTIEHIRTQVLGIMRINDMQLTQRYAPGYCGWPINDQKILLSLIQPEKIGVRLTESYMLEPTHTVTGVFGIRMKETIKENIPCYACTSISCKVHFDFHKELNTLMEISDGSE